MRLQKMLSTLGLADKCQPMLESADMDFDTLQDTLKIAGRFLLLSVSLSLSNSLSLFVSL